MPMNKLLENQTGIFKNIREKGIMNVQLSKGSHKSLSCL